MPQDYGSLLPVHNRSSKSKVFAFALGVIATIAAVNMRLGLSTAADEFLNPSIL